MKHDRQGSSALWLVLLVLVVAMTGVIGWRVYEARSSANIGTTSAEATLTGTVTEGPTAPVCREGDSCTRTVSNHTIEALDVSNSIAATSKTDDNGRYTLRLQPGRYTLILVPQIGLGHTANGQVDVKAGITTHDLTVDTGIR